MKDNTYAQTVVMPTDKYEDKYKPPYTQPSATRAEKIAQQLAIKYGQSDGQSGGTHYAAAADTKLAHRGYAAGNDITSAERAAAAQLEEQKKKFGSIAGIPTRKDGNWQLDVGKLIEIIL